MSTRRKPEQIDERKLRSDTADVTRNEVQKSLLLYEVGRLRRKEASELIQRCTETVARSKKLCGESKSLLNHSKRQAS